MGYEIYITRRAHWWDDGDPEITLDEWRAIVEADPQLIVMDAEPEDPLAAMMRSDPGPNASARYFHYSDGQIWVKKPSKEVLFKMLHIAKILGARVIGDDEEIYREDGTPDRVTSHVVKDW